MRLSLALETPERSQTNPSFLLRKVLRRSPRSPLQPALSAVPRCQVSVLCSGTIPSRVPVDSMNPQAFPSQAIRTGFLFLDFFHCPMSLREKFLRWVSCLPYILS